MLLLGIDLEVGGAFALPHKDQFLTEVGAVLWCTERNMPVKILSELIYTTNKIAEEAEIYTGITSDVCQQFGTPKGLVLDQLSLLMERADYIVAHNGNQFDRPVLQAQMPDMPKKVWLDTMIDVDYPSNCRNRNLTYLAGFHQILNCFPHRAVTDALTMMSVLAKYDIEKVIANAKAEKIIISAGVSYDNRNLAKEKGFFWQECDGKTFEKKWVKKIKKTELEKYSKEYPFPIIILEDVGNGQ